MELAKKLKIPDVLSSISNKEAIDRQNIEFFTRIGEVDRKIGGIRRFFRIKKIPGIRLHQMAMREEGKFEKLMKIFRDSAHVTVMADGYMELYTGVEMGR